MANIGDIFFGLHLSDAGLLSQAKASGSKAGNVAGAAMSKGVNNSLGSQLGKGFVQGLGLAGALGAANLASSAVGAVTDLIGTSIQAASDLNETVTKSEVIFGDAADGIMAWADTAATGFGQSKRAALDAASTFAGLFQTVGIANDEAAERAKKLTELGSDLASFFNTDVSEALLAIRSGLSGESEPLRRFNIFLSETAVSAKLAQLGIKKVGGQFTESQKATARYLLILEQTGAAQGDFARTSDGLANSQRILNAEMENLQAQLGQEFLPIAKQVTEWQLDFLRGLGVVGSGIDEFAGGLTDIQNNINGVVEGITPWQELTETWRKEGRRAAAFAIRDVAEGIESGKSDVTAAAETAVSGVPGAVEKIKPEVKKSAKEIAGAVADALRSERTTIDSLIDELNERRTKPPISLTKEVEGLISTLLSPTLAADLVSPDPLTRAIARELKESIEERLGEIKLRPGVMADRVKEMLEKANTASDPVTRDLAHDIGDLYVDSLVDRIGSGANQQRLNEAIKSLFGNVPDFVWWGVQGALTPPPHAPGRGPTELDTGMPFVPFDRMPAILHRGEAVLTAEENADRLAGSRVQNFNIEHLELADAHDEFSMTQQLQFLTAVGP